MSFNEVPGNDDHSGGLARRLKIVDFIKKYVDNPESENNELQVVDGLLDLSFATKPYGAAFLAYLMVVYNEHGFNITVPASIKEASKKYIEDNKTFDRLHPPNRGFAPYRGRHHGPYISMRDSRVRREVYSASTGIPHPVPLSTSTRPLVHFA
jgi:hypothetical protein